VFCHELSLLDTSRVGIQLHLAKAIFRSMGPPDQPPEAASADSPSAQLARCLSQIRFKASESPTLLFLDNMESLTEHAVSGVEDILSGLADMPNVACLTTSRNKSLRPRHTGSAELPALSFKDSWLVFEDRLQASIPPNERQAMEAVVKAMEGHPLSVVLLAAYARVNSVSAAVRGWPMYGTDVLRNGDMKDKHGSLAASVELSLDSIDVSKTSPSRMLLHFLSNQLNGFPVEPEGAVSAFSQQDPQAIQKLLQLSLVFIRQPYHPTEASTFHVLQPISQYLQDKYGSFGEKQSIDICRSYMAVLACLGRSRSDDWLHGSSAVEQSQRFKTCICRLLPPAIPYDPIDLTRYDPPFYCSSAEQVEHKIRPILQQAAASILLEAPRHFRSGDISLWEFGASLLNLAMTGEAQYVYAWPLPSSAPFSGGLETPSATLYALVVELESHANL
jgi:hypothetical protein